MFLWKLKPKQIDNIEELERYTELMGRKGAWIKFHEAVQFTRKNILHTGH